MWFRTLLLSWLVRARAAGWDDGWQSMEPSVGTDDTAALRRKLDQARRELAACRGETYVPKATSGAKEDVKLRPWTWPSLHLNASTWSLLVDAALVAALAAGLAGLFFYLPSPAGLSPRGRLRDLRLPLTEAARPRWPRCFARWPLGWPSWSCSRLSWPSWCRLPQTLSCKSPLFACMVPSCGLGAKLSCWRPKCLCAWPSFLRQETENWRTPWRQTAQKARQSLLQAQEQVDVALGEAQLRLQDAVTRAERAEAEAKQLRGFLQESNARAEAAESRAKKCRNETEELKVSFRKAEETAAKARQDLQHARKRAEVAETSAAAAAPTAAPKPMGSGKASEDTPKVKAPRRPASERSVSRSAERTNATALLETPRLKVRPLPDSGPAGPAGPAGPGAVPTPVETPRLKARPDSSPVGALMETPRLKAREARPSTSTSATQEALREALRTSRGRLEGARGISTEKLPERRDSREEKFSYNRSLAMLKFTEAHAGPRQSPSSAITSATSSMVSLPRDEGPMASPATLSSPSPTGSKGAKSRFLLA